jgi:hypothetical protein
MGIAEETAVTDSHYSPLIVANRNAPSPPPAADLQTLASHAWRMLWKHKRPASLGKSAFGHNSGLASPLKQEET